MMSRFNIFITSKIKNLSFIKALPLIFYFYSECGFALENNNQLPVSIPITELQDYNTNPDLVKKAIALLLNLAKQRLHYQYGSADPNIGGMDCSGTMFYVLNSLKIEDVPRSSDLQHEWVTNKGHFYAVSEQVLSPQAKEFSYLQPGDLLFWTGTYAIKRNTNVTHVMMYIGKNKKGELLMAGASNGRTYQGKKIDGVSVFDFKVPDRDSHGHFIGYGCVPELNCS